jgi:formate dehydrogenase (coenzyme F420) beta subunit
MAATAKIEVLSQDIVKTLREFFRSLLELREIDAILVPRQLPMKNMVMPALVSDTEGLGGVNPLAPAFPMNTAKLVARLTRKPAGAKFAAVMRPCEIRAFIELVKLKQGNIDDVVIVGLDCLGAYENTEYFRFAGKDLTASTRQFYQSALKDSDAPIDDHKLAPACQVCEHPIPSGADLAIGLLGMNTEKEILVEAHTPAGETLLSALKLPATENPASRQQAIDALIARRTEHRDAMFAETHAATDSLEKLTAYLATCVNCYNCRVACPVCYCRECVFVTDVFDHEPTQYMRWAARKGCIKMPTDTVFYHLTRLAHMSTACVGCGQCSNACPNDIPVMELFRTMAHRAQREFEYEAGRSLEEKPPLSDFKEEEFDEVVGIRN